MKTVTSLFLKGINHKSLPLIILQINNYPSTSKNPTRNPSGLAF